MRKDKDASSADEQEKARQEVLGSGTGEQLPARTGGGGMALGHIDGDVDPSDIQLPRLQLAYGVGKLAESFNPGDWVLNQDTFLAKKGDPVTVIVLHANKYWKEYLEFGTGVLPRLYKDDEEVLANGGTIAWSNGPDGVRVGPTFRPAMDIKLLVQAPKDVIGAAFGVDLGKNKYAPAEYSVDKSAYKEVGPQILTAKSFSLRVRGLQSGFFQLHSRTEKIGGNNTIVPAIRLTGNLSDGELAELAALFPG